MTGAYGGFVTGMRSGAHAVRPALTHWDVAEARAAYLARDAPSLPLVHSLSLLRSSSLCHSLSLLLFHFTFSLPFCGSHPFHPCACACACVFLLDWGSLCSDRINPPSSLKHVPARERQKGEETIWRLFLAVVCGLWVSNQRHRDCGGEKHTRKVCMRLKSHWFKPAAKHVGCSSVFSTLKDHPSGAIKCDSSSFWKVWHLQEMLSHWG